MSIKLVMEVKALTERLVALEKRVVGAVEGEAHTAATDVTAEFASVRKDLGALADAFDKRIAEVEDAFEARLSAIEQKLKIAKP